MHQISVSPDLCPGSPAGGAYSADPLYISGFRGGPREKDGERGEQRERVGKWEGERRGGRGETCSMGSRGIDAPATA